MNTHYLFTDSLTFTATPLLNLDIINGDNKDLPTAIISPSSSVITASDPGFMLFT